MGNRGFPHLLYTLQAVKPVNWDSVDVRRGSLAATGLTLCYAMLCCAVGSARPKKLKSVSRKKKPAKQQMLPHVQPRSSR
jgi:hypothetical protein